MEPGAHDGGLGRGRIGGHHRDPVPVEARDLTFWPDLLVRLAKTFLASLAGSFGADAFTVLAFNWASALDLAAVATLSALAKGLLARQPAQGGNATPSTLPTPTYEKAVASSRDQPLI